MKLSRAPLADRGVAVSARQGAIVDLDLDGDVAVSGDASTARLTSSSPTALSSTSTSTTTSTMVPAALTLLAALLMVGPATAFAGSDADTPKEPMAPADVDAALKERLTPKEYRFCAEEPPDRYRPSPRTCELAEAAGPRCPGLAKICNKVKEAPPIHLPDKPSSWDFKISGLLAGFARVVFWGLVVGLAVWLVIALLRAWRRWRGDDDEVEESTDGDAQTNPSAPPKPTRPRSVDDLLEEADRAALAGDFRRAIDAAFAGLLRHLDWQGTISLHPSRTNGDYVRSVRGQPEIHGPLRFVALAIERLQFGTASATRELFDEVWTRVEPLVKTTAAILLAVCLATMTACSLGEGDGPGDDGGSFWPSTGKTGPEGFRLLHELLARRGAKVHLRLRRVDSVPEGVNTVIVFGEIDDKEWPVLLDWADAGGNLIVVAPPEAQAERIGAKPLEGEGPPAGNAGACAAEVVVTWGDEESPREAEATVTLPPDGLTIVGDGPTALFSCNDAPYAVLKTTSGGGRVLSLPNTEWFTNAALAAGDNAFVLLHALEPLAGRLEIIDRSAGGGAGVPTAAIANTGLLPVSLHLLVLVLALCLWRWPFGKMRDPVGVSRRSFAEHVRALGAQYARATASDHALAAYATWAFERWRERLRVGSREPSALARSIAAQAGLPPEIVRGILDRARAVQAAMGDVAAAEVARPTATATPGVGSPATARASLPRPIVIGREARHAIASHLSTLKELAMLLKKTGGFGDPRATR